MATRTGWPNLPQHLRWAAPIASQVVRVAAAIAILFVIESCRDHPTGPDSSGSHGRPATSSLNEAPTATIITPEAGLIYSGGDRITYSGSATDPDEGQLPPSRLAWWVDFHHDDHTHPFLPLTEGADWGEVLIPTVGETSDNVWYRFYLRATDSQGATHTAFSDVHPWKVTLTLATEPAGLQVTLDGQPRVTPLSVTAVVGIERELGVVSPQTVGAAAYAFTSWSDSGAATHTIRTPDTDATYTATYTAAGTNEAPTATIITPEVGVIYSGGDRITYSGSATDPDEGALPASRLTWWADFHHDDHTHPFLPVTEGVADGSVTIPTVGETSDNVWYRFYLRATDSQGATHTVFRDVHPRKVTLTLATEPAGLQVTLDGQPRVTPLSVTAVVGIERELGVVSPQTVGAAAYAFTSWSDGGTATHTISTPSTNATYTATYEVGAANEPPIVSLTAPPGGGSAEVNTAVTISAYALDNDGGITLVEFFDGTTLIGAEDAPIGPNDRDPYSITWTPTTAGTRNLTARATDNRGAQTTSAPVSFTVRGSAGVDTERPVVTLTAPANQATNLIGPLTVTATASDNVGVEGVQFQLDGENLGPEDTSAPYSTTLTSTGAYTSGVHVLRARARDAGGNVSQWDVATVTFGGSVSMPAGFGRTTYSSGLSAVTAMAFAPDGRLFICQQNGALRVVPAGGGAPLATPFHRFTVTNSGEQGLLGIAFHPNFAANGWVYVYYTSPTPTNHNRVSRVVASSSNPNVSTGVETVLLDDLPTVPTGGNHNGGGLHFSPDGRLYLAIGDQASPSNAQSLNSRFGKILRYNDDLTIPADNPFFGTATGANRAIWARGLRNPFTFGFQPGTGRMFINDVGEATWEEVNDGVAGSNYGWPTSEGPTTNPSFRSPIYAYRHSGGLVTGFAIVGAAFYNPPSRTFPPAYLGHYFFADYVEGWINRLDPGNDNAVYAFARIGDSVFDLTVGPDGALYALAAGGGAFLVYRYQFQ